MKHRLAAAAIAVLAVTAHPALAAPKTEKDPQTLASEGINSLLRAMEMMLMAIPQFEAPYINEDGDIIIRRKNPDQRPDTPERSGPGPRGKTI